MDQLSADDPRSVGPYAVFGRLGSGGMGTVYLGRSAGGRTVAVKTIHPELARQAQFRTRFRDEVAAARRVSGAFTAPVVDADPEAPLPWLATAFVPGVALAAAVRDRGPLPGTALRMLAAGVAEALVSIHATGLIHRDLKPANVLLALDGPHVIDFGISRAADGASVTSAGTVIGTPGYMSPEQAMGEPLTTASDVFSLGSTLVYAASAAVPFGDGPTPAILFRVVNQQLDVGALPAGLRELVAACLAKEPAGRPTPAEIVEHVRRTSGPADFGGGSVGSWLPGGVTADVVAAGAVIAQVPAPTGDTTVAVPSVSVPSASAPRGVAGSAATASATAPATSSPSGSPGSPVPSVPPWLTSEVKAGGSAPSTDTRVTEAVPNIAASSPLPTLVPQAPSAPRPSRRKLLLGAAGGAAVLVGGGVAAAVAWSDRTEQHSISVLTEKNPARELWRRPGLSDVAQVPVAATHGTVVLAGTDGHRAFSSSGAALWGATPDNKVTDPERALYVVGGTGYLVDEQALKAIDLATGATRVTNIDVDYTEKFGAVIGIRSGLIYLIGSHGDDSVAAALPEGATKPSRSYQQSAGFVVAVPPTGTTVLIGSSASDGTSTVHAFDIGAKASPPPLLWATSVTDLPDSSGDQFQMIGGLLVSARKSVVALNTERGVPAWTFVTDPDPQPSTGATHVEVGLGRQDIVIEDAMARAEGKPQTHLAAGPDGTTLFAQSDTLHALDAKTGVARWRVTRPDGSSPKLIGRPQCADGNVYILDSESKLWALDAHTGDVRWHYQFTVDLKRYGTPAFLAGDKHVYVIDPGTGALIALAA